MEVTGYELCRTALKKSGVFGRGQTPLSEDINDAFTDLRGMLDQWQRKRWNVYHLVDLPLVSTGAVGYTVGPGGDFDIATRPDKIDSAFIRISPGGAASGGDFNTDFGDDFGGTAVGTLAVDFPLQVITSREDYNLIAVKGLGSFPDCLYYDPGYPLGVALVYPVPSAGIYEIHLTTKAVLAPDLALTADISLPSEYYEALLYNLAVRLRPANQLAPDPSITALAAASLNTIKGANAQVPTLGMPRGMPGRGGRYNIYSDR